jgi:hypothetical protein
MRPGDYEALLQARLAAVRASRVTAGRARTQPRGRVRAKAAVLMAATALLVSAVGVFADGGSFSVEVADKTGYEVGTTDDGAIVEYIGDDNVTFGASGSGIFESFLQTQDDPSEEGYNTDGDKEFDTGSSPTFNHAILVSEIPVVTCESLDGLTSTAGLCWELFADINDSNANDPAAAQIQLTELEIWFTDDDEITGYDQTGAGFGGDADLTYDFEGTILINDVNQGSGRGDLRYLIPLNGIDFPIPADCDYGSSACTTFFVVYTEWGDPSDGDYKSDSGFEEWKVKRYPFLDVTKTAATTFTRTFEWTIDKSVTPDSWAIFDGDSGTSDYTVDLTKGAGTDSDWAVSGTITIENPSEQDATIVSVDDVVSGAGAATVICGVAFPYVLPEGDTLVCTYSKSLSDGTDRTNTATATLVDGPVFMGDAAVTFGSPTTLVNDTVHVTDTYAGGPQNQAFSASGSATYSRTFECGADEGQHDNTATITETSQFDDASVTVTCYDLTVTKTADESFTRTYEWDIQKSADQDALTLMPGEVFPVNYTVTVDVIGETDSDFMVEGDITIHNNHPTLAADLNSVVDEIFDGIAATVVCPSLTVPAGGDLVCTYEVDVPDASTRENLATATQQNYDYDSDGIGTAGGTTDYQGTEDAVFGDPTELVDECVDVNDTIGGFLGTVCVDDDPPPPTDLTYSHDVGPYTVEDCGEQNVPNTADLLTNDTDATDESSWNIVVTIPCPEGCTLTMGYWKTHNEEFWGGAPEDPNWYLIGDVDGDFVSEGPNEDFFDTGMTWFDVFWENPAGRPYYQLAHQWMAAYINKLSIEAIGGSIPAAVQDALDDGAVLLDEYDGSEADKTPDIKGKDAKAIRAEFVELAGILGDFNEGTTGPGHCDEPIVIVDGQPVSGSVFLWPIGLVAPLAARMRRRGR